MAVYDLSSLVETVMMAASNKQGESGMIIEIDMTLEQLMAKLGCAHGLIVEALHAKLVANYKIEGVQIDSGDYHAIAPIKLGVLQDILHNKVPKGGAACSLAKVGLEKAVKSVLVQQGGTFSFGPAPAGAPIKFLDTEGGVGDIFKVKPKPNPLNQQEIEKLANMLKELSHTLPALKDATDLYQPVHGTDEGSTYYVIALNDTLKVAARIKNKNKVSLRVEGSGMKALKPKLKAAGLVDSGTYCSVHLSADTDDLARKSIGAVLFGIGEPFQKVATNMALIWGKGQ
jgi:hypothetical protein